MIALQLESLNLDAWPFTLLEITYGRGTQLQLELLYSKHDRTQSRANFGQRGRLAGGRREVALLVVERTAKIRES